MTFQICLELRQGVTLVLISNLSFNIAWPQRQISAFQLILSLVDSRDGRFKVMGVRGWESEDDEQDIYEPPSVSNIPGSSGNKFFGSKNVSDGTTASTTSHKGVTVSL